MILWVFQGEGLREFGRERDTSLNATTSLDLKTNAASVSQTLITVLPPTECYSNGSDPFGEKSASSVIQVVGRIHFFAVVGLRSLFLGWLSARGLNQLCMAPIFLLLWPLHLQAGNGTLNSSPALSL